MTLTCQFMLRKGLLCFLLMAFLIRGQHASAQQTARKVFKGVVTSEKGEPVPGASVIIKGTGKGVSTDATGAFSIEAEEGTTIEVSAVGYQKRSSSLKGTGLISVSMHDVTGNLNEVVVVGYGTQKRKDLTGSVGTVSPDVLTKVATNDVLKAMQGQVAGVSVSGSGQPGATPTVKIRGIGTFGRGDPLYVVDGVFTPINDLVMSDVESVQVLKDGSAAAIYGSRAANGVVIITTKRGKTGKLKLDYHGYYGVQNIVKRYNAANSQEYQMLVNEATANANQDPIPPLSVKPANDPSSPYYVRNINTDWQEEAFKTGKIMEHNVGISGGSEAAKYFVSLNLYDHKGTVVGNGPSYKRYSFRVNSDFKQGRIKFGESMSYTRVDQRFMSFLHTGNIMGFIVNAIPTLPVYDSSTRDDFSSASQQIHGSYTANAIGFNSLLDSKTDRYRFIGNLYGELEIIRGLKYKLNVGFERTDWRDLYFQPIHDLGWFYVNNIAKMNDWRGNGTTGTLENTLTYDKIVGKHTINALLGHSVLESYTNRIFGHSEGFSQPYFKVLSAGATGINLTGDQYASRLLSYFGRVNYNYGDRYLLTATIRRDGSSRFAPANRFGNFPSIALGWRLSNEAFMKNILPDAINMIKLRASYGELGNQEIGDYVFQQYINPYAHAVFGNQLATGSTYGLFVDPNIKWEGKISRNIGADFQLFNKLNFSAEYYENKGRDILSRISIPGSTGVYPWEGPVVNGVSLQNKGFEFQAGYSDTKGDWNYSVNANLSTLKNKVLALGYGDKPIYGYGNMTKTEVGREVGELYGWVIDGIFQTQEEINQLNIKSPNGMYQEKYTRPGDYRFKDINSFDANGKLTGKTDGKVDDADRTYLGSVIPRLYYGFNFNVGYKGLDLSMVAGGHAGNKIFNALRASIENGAGWDNYSKNLLNRWTPSNRNTDVPRVVIADPNRNARASSRWLEDGDFLRINSLQLGYTLPKNLLSRARFTNARVYVTAQNLITFTKYTGFDPDFANNNGLFDRAIDNGSYPNRPFTANEAGGLPNPRTFIFGLQFGL